MFEVDVKNVKEERRGGDQLGFGVLIDFFFIYLFKNYFVC